MVLAGCSAKIKTNITNKGKALAANEKVAFLDVHHTVPEHSKKIGDAHFGDSGFSTDCNFDSNLIKARKIARENGANIVKITESKKPDIVSGCHRMTITFYRFDGDVTTLQQYQLQIK